MGAVAVIDRGQHAPARRASLVSLGEHHQAACGLEPKAARLALLVIGRRWATFPEPWRPAVRIALQGRARSAGRLMLSDVLFFFFIDSPRLARLFGLPATVQQRQAHEFVHAIRAD